MAGLTDMEELISLVSEKDIANYLREALVCYGSGAYRGCIVLTNIALFEGLRQKLLALAPVNSVARTVSNVIEPIAAGQKVFELTLIHQMKSASIITQLEADILEQLNKQRHKAAHPSGHIVSAEEARFVFSESISKFLSQPIRQTSVAVDNIVDRISDPNFFPSVAMVDITAVVDQETENLDQSAIPQLINKLFKIVQSNTAPSNRSSGFFLLALALRKDETIRSTLTRVVLDQKSTDDAFSELISTLVCADPSLLDGLKPATSIRVAALLMKNATTIGVHVAYNQYRNPANLLEKCLSVLGENFMIAQYKKFTDWVIEQAPSTKEFIVKLSKQPILMKSLLDSYCERASSSKFDVSNLFARTFSTMDEALSQAITDKEAFRLLAAVVKGADWGGWVSIDIVAGSFASVPQLKLKATNFLSLEQTVAEEIIESYRLGADADTFRSSYLG